MEGDQTSNRYNQGIVDGRPAGVNPPLAPVLGDTIIDTNAGYDSPQPPPTAHRGPDSSATSQDLHRGLGHPGSGMSSKELHHNGHPQGRKREGQGVSQFGPPKTRDIELDRAQRPTGANTEST